MLASDLGHGPLYASTTVVVRPADANEHSPVVLVQSPDDNEPQRLRVVENSPRNTFIAHVLVTDADFGTAGHVECVLDDPELNFHLERLFTETYRSVEYKLLSAVSFDREYQAVYELSLTCQDLGEPRRLVQHPLVIEVDDVDDNDPVFINTSYHFTVPENNSRRQVGLYLYYTKPTCLQDK